MNKLRVLRSTTVGLFLEGGECGDVLMPARYIPADLKPDDTVEVFVLLDSEARLTAIPRQPYAMVGDFATLRVVSVTGVGAFLDWGMPKDLFVPFREQRIKMKEGEFWLVRIYHDAVSNRLAASSKLNRFLDRTAPDYRPNEAVDLIIYEETELGFKAIINSAHQGMLFRNEAFLPLRRGQRIQGYIRQVRADGKIDLCLQPPGYEKVSELAENILRHLEQEGGFMPVTVKSPPKEIYARFGVSKKSYRQAVGALYKKRLVTFEDGGTRRIDD